MFVFCCVYITAALLGNRAESGFTHVEPEKYEPRLLHIKGKKVNKLYICTCSGISISL